GDGCSIRFTMGDSADVLHAYEIDANVVRFFEVKGRVAMGCTVKFMPPGLLESLNQKETEKMLQAAMEADSDDIELDIDLKIDPSKLNLS
nr:hypothetical protein [Lachnospiraceae bacterium]